MKLKELGITDKFWVDDDGGMMDMFNLGMIDRLNEVLDHRPLGVLVRTPQGVKEYYSPDTDVVAYDPFNVWIPAICYDSHNFLPKKVPKDAADKAMGTEITEYFLTEIEAQRECDHLNSL